MLAHFAPTEAWQFCEGQVRAGAADMQQSLWCTNPRLFHADPEGTSVPSPHRATAHRQGHQGAGDSTRGSEPEGAPSQHGMGTGGCGQGMGMRREAGSVPGVPGPAKPRPGCPSWPWVPLSRDGRLQGQSARLWLSALPPCQPLPRPCQAPPWVPLSRGGTTSGPERQAKAPSPAALSALTIFLQ